MWSILAPLRHPAELVVSLVGTAGHEFRMGLLEIELILLRRPEPIHIGLCKVLQRLVILFLLV